MSYDGERYFKTHDRFMALDNLITLLSLLDMFNAVKDITMNDALTYSKRFTQ